MVVLLFVHQPAAKKSKVITYKVFAGLLGSMFVLGENLCP